MDIFIWVGLVIALVVFGALKDNQKKIEREIAGKPPLEEDEEKLLTSKTLHEEWTEERKKRGMTEIPAINNSKGANTGNLARMDKSWKSAPGFFAKMLKKKDK